MNKRTPPKRTRGTKPPRMRTPRKPRPSAKEAGQKRGRK